MRLLFLLFVLVFPACSPLSAQKGTSPRYGQERLLIVCPLIGDGSYANPRRPMFTPSRGQTTQFTGFHWVLADNGRLAIVEITAKSRAAFISILSDRTPEVRVFDRARDKKDDVERELKLLKRDFTLERFAGLTR